MGTFNQFRDLNQEGVATKLFKFQMAVMRDAAKSGGFTNNSHVEILKGGMCTAYTLLWLREQWKMDGAFAFARDGKYTGALGPVGGGVGMLGVRLQTLFEHNVKSQESVEMALEAIGRTVGLELKVSNSEQYDSVDDALQALFDSTEVGTYYVEMYMKRGKEETSHAIGVYAAQGGSFFVFDANCGEYLVTGPTTFAILLCDVYEKQRSSRFEECIVTKVTYR